MVVLELEVVALDGARERVRVEDPALVVAGWTGRDAEALQRHVDELAAHGVAPPSEVPLTWPMPGWLLVGERDDVDVRTSESSGEAEAVLVRLPSGERLVAVGSDQTDRALERDSVPLSKLVCPKVVGPQAWRFDDVAAHWDELRLRAYVGDADTLYQDERLAAVRPPDELLDRAERVAPPDRPYVLFCGTVPFQTPGLRYDRRFVAMLEDAEHGRSLRCAYTVRSVAASARA
jgi:hypothetical protein